MMVKKMESHRLKKKLLKIQFQQNLLLIVTNLSNFYVTIFLEN